MNASYDNAAIPGSTIDATSLQSSVSNADVAQTLSTIPSVNLTSDQSPTTKVSPYFMGQLAPNEVVDPSLGYQIQQGDSLNKITGGNQTYAGAIANANNLTSDVIYPGQMLTMPTNFDEGAAYITGSLFNTQASLRAAAFAQAQNLASQIPLPNYVNGTSQDQTTQNLGGAGSGLTLRQLQSRKSALIARSTIRNNLWECFAATGN